VTDQRRVHERFPIELPVTIVSGESRVPGRTQNVSLGGMLITVDSPVPFGAAVTVRVRLPALSEELDIAATVRWTGGSAIGVQFGSLRAKATWALNQIFKDQRG
jgi:hypothetical protein